MYHTVTVESIKIVPLTLQMALHKTELNLFSFFFYQFLELFIQDSRGSLFSKMDQLFSPMHCLFQCYHLQMFFFTQCFATQTKKRTNIFSLVSYLLISLNFILKTGMQCFCRHSIFCRTFQKNIAMQDSHCYSSVELRNKIILFQIK